MMLGVKLLTFDRGLKINYRNILERFASSIYCIAFI